MVLRLEATEDEVQALRHMLSPEARRQCVFDPQSNTATVPEKYKAEVDAAIRDPSEGMRKYLLEYAGRRRFEFETRSIIANGIWLSMDRIHRSMLLGAQFLPDNELSWKGSDGAWHVLSKAQVEGLAKVAALHVQTAFTIEAQIVKRILAKEITRTAEIDAAFPAAGARRV